MPAGDHKGFALALLVEIICGSMIGMDMMQESTAGLSMTTKMPRRGAFILVIDPAQTTTTKKFKHANSELLEMIRAMHSAPGQTIRIPGERGGGMKNRAEQAGVIELPNALWADICAL
jgi:LDH2 family malate/lactate/ureidoglycolate dehydrogenase